MVNTVITSSMTRYGDHNAKGRELTAETDRNGAPYYQKVQEMIKRHTMSTHKSAMKAMREAQRHIDSMRELELEALTAKCNPVFKSLPAVDEKGRCPDCKKKVEEQFGNCKCTK